ncbi:MAG: YkgJ family cysteine cluster protein [Candidatus Bathyarchaeia archaeon]
MSSEYPRHIRFLCDKCAKCCGDTNERVRTILMLKSESARISKETGLSIGEFSERAGGFEPYTYHVRKTQNGKCVFLKGNLCSIYEIRPLICRFYPFKLENIGNDRYVFSCTDECPGIGNGNRLDKAFYENLFAEFKKAMKENVHRKPT